MTKLLNLYRMNSEWDCETMITVKFTDKFEQHIMNINDALDEYDEEYDVEFFDRKSVMLRHI